MIRKGTVTVVGAGLSGPAIAILLARAGYQVELLDQRPAPARASSPGISIGLTLARRGIDVLARLDVLPAVMARAVELKGRMIHRSDGRVAYQPYGRTGDDVIFSIRRDDLSSVLLEAAENSPNVSIRYGTRCAKADFPKRSITLQTGPADEVRALRPGDFVVGADGTFSTIRASINHARLSEFHQTPLEWIYKEVALSTEEAAAAFEPNVFHMWPRGDQLLLVVPTFDGSYTCTYFFPRAGRVEFGPAATRFREKFPDVAPLVDDLDAAFGSNSEGRLMSVTTRPWSYEDAAVLVGDACHTFAPFYGQGMNSSMEDCAILTDCLIDHPGDLPAAFAKYEACRRNETDLMTALSLQNFVEIRERIDSRWFNFLKAVDNGLSRVMRERWVPLYSLIMHTSMSYRAAVRQVKKQRRDLLLGALGVLGTLSAVAVAAIGRRRRRWARTVGGSNG